MNKTQTSSGGISISTILGVVFIILKLTGVIAWSWWWVLAPFWLPVAIVIGLVIIAFAGAVVATWIER